MNENLRTNQEQCHARTSNALQEGERPEANFAIQLFEGKKVRFVWDEEQEKYYFAVVDIVQVLTESADYQTARKYWKVLKGRLLKEGNETVTNCYQLKLPAADGKNRLTDVADLEQIFRLIQSIPSKKAEPVKKWLAEVGAQRIDQMIDPELTFQMAVEDYRRQGYSDRWINERMRSIEMRKELTDEWHRSGIHEPKDFAILTNVLTKAWSGMTTGEYKRHKGLTKENLRDNMTNVELALNNTLAEVATTEIARQRKTQGMKESRQSAQAGGQIAKNTRDDLERQLGRTVISSERASDYIRPIESQDADALQLPDEEK
ncbi:MAG: hypothetical protein IJT75_01740 [Bacteroidaceae bacterium]|nr:hypothetical protein [Bacteroidaceae bacterium]